MNDKMFKIVVGLIILGSLAGVYLFGDRTPIVRTGDEHEDNGQEHIAAEESPAYNGEEPPTSGEHAQPVPKGVYDYELPDVNTIHNLEHGYIYISYQPDLDQETIDKLSDLFFAPFSNSEFSPLKVIMAPRAANTSPIVLSSWIRSKKFESFNEVQLMEYYLTNVNKSPEPLAE